MADRIAREVYGLLFEKSTEAVLVVDRATGAIVSANLRAADMLACDLEAILGTPFAAATLEPERDLSAPGHYEEVALRRADGFPLYAEVDVVHVDVPGQGALAAYMARDTSERRMLQRELLVKHSALYTTHAELQRAHAQLAAAKHELETRNEQIALLAWRAALGELVAGIAHHLNNPVGALASTIPRMTALVAALPDAHRGELERLLARVSQISRRIEANVTAIVHATRSHAQGGTAHALPPELAAALMSLTEKLDEIPIKDRQS